MGLGARWALAPSQPWTSIDFWVDDGHEPEVAGSAPVVSPNGQPNVCWIIRWPSRAAREEGFRTTLGSQEWQDIWRSTPTPTPTSTSTCAS